MKTILTAAAVAAAAAATPALSQVAVADVDGAVNASAAYQGAQAQIKTAFKSQIDALNARQQALTAQLQPLRTEIETLSKDGKTPRATIEAKVTAYRTQESNAQRELAAIAAPLQRPNAYVEAQIGEKFDAAVRAAMQAKGVKIVVRPDVVLARTPESDITTDITAQLNTMLPSVSITPPADWQPGQPLAAPAAPAKKGR